MLKEHNPKSESAVALALAMESAKQDASKLGEAAASSSVSINAVKVRQKEHVS